MINKLNNPSPMWLPQIEDDQIEELLNELEEMGVIVKKVMIEPKFLKPLQNKVQKSKIDKFNQIINKDEYLPQTWVDSDNNILDGHHRFYTYLSRPDIDKIECYKVFLKALDACAIITKIVDRMNFKKEFNIDSEKYDVKDYMSKQTKPEEETEEELTEFVSKNKKKTDSPEDKESNIEDDLSFEELGNQVVKLYSTKPLNSKAPTGSILSFNKGTGFDREYEIQFDKVLEVPAEECDLHDPIYLAAVYILNHGFEQDINKIKQAASTANVNIAEFCKAKANQFAKQKGYDAINFGNKFMLVVTQ